MESSFHVFSTQGPSLPVKALPVEPPPFFRCSNSANMALQSLKKACLKLLWNTKMYTLDNVYSCDSQAQH